MLLSNFEQLYSLPDSTNEHSWTHSVRISRYIISVYEIEIYGGPAQNEGPFHQSTSQIECVTLDGGIKFEQKDMDT